MSQTVLRRDGTREPVRFDRILERVQRQAEGLRGVDVVRVTKTVVQGVHDGVTTRALDDLAAETAASLTARHPNYSVLAARIAISRLHKHTQASVECLYPFLADDCLAFAREHQSVLDKAIVWERDLRQYDYFGFKTLERSYLLRDATGAIVERP